uniref:RDD domain-containing protein n=1 Tax=Caenorhabditis japonica TaxID=281687 RepID=A0A8R1DML1_CAEJA
METRKRFREVYGLPDETHDYGSMQNFANAHRDYIAKMHEYQRQQDASVEQRRQLEAWRWANLIQGMITPLLTPPTSAPTPASIAALHRNGQQQQQQGVEIMQFEVASFLRRLLAEFIDFLFFLSFKLFVIGALTESGLLDLKSLGQALEDNQDMMQFIGLAQDLLPVEIICKMLCCFLEGMIMAYGIGPIGKGQTLGKWILGIRVISCREVTHGNTPDHITVEGPNIITWKQSMKRSFLKNVVVNGLFPLSTAAFQVTNGRVFYDFVLKTVVVMDV